MILEDICDVYSGYAIKQFNEDKIGVPVIKIGNILMDWTIELEDCQYTTEKVNQKYYSEYQDIYIALSGATTGKIGILKRQEKFIVNQRVGIVRKKDNNIPIEFIKYFLFHHTDRIFKEAAGCAQPNISPKQIGKYKVPIIDDSRMKYVVEILDSLTRIINKRKRQLNYLDELIKARFVEMFNGKNYPREELENLSHGKGEYGAQSASVEYNSSRPRYVRITDIKEDGSLNDDFVCSANIEDDELYKLEYGDFCFARMGATVGKTYAYRGGNQIFAGYLIRYKLNLNRIIPEYLYEFTRLHEYRNWVSLNQSGAAQPGINAKKYGSLRIPVAPLEEQRVFAKFVGQVDKSKVEVKRALDEAQLLFDSLMQKYFG